MKLRQLEYLREIVRNGLNVSRAARRLHTSQPSISQQILTLERELGFTLFVREKSRLTKLTSEGEQVVRRAESVLLDVDYIRGLRKAGKGERDAFVIATTHTQARYVIPEALSVFAKRYPTVHVTLRHGNAEQIRDALESGTADIGITPDTGLPTAAITALECRRYDRIVLAQAGHPLTKRKCCTLSDLVQYPFITLEPAISARQTVLEVFQSAGLALNIILSAIDADVVKACVERGLGLTVLIEVAYDTGRDSGILPVRTNAQFPPSITSVAIHRQRQLPPFAYEFIEMFSPRWTRTKVDQALSRRPRATRVASAAAPRGN